MRAGQLDLIVAALPSEAAELGQIEFSAPYFVDGKSTLTRAERTVQSWADLNQKAVAITGGATEMTALIGDTTIAPIWLPFQESRSAQQALLAGQVDAVIGSSIGFSQTVQANRTQDLRNYSWERQHPAGCRQDGGAPGCVSPGTVKIVIDRFVR